MRPVPCFGCKMVVSLTREIFTSAVCVALSTLGYDSTGHSFRIGAATTVAERGVEDSVIKMLGRWESSAYSRYVRTPRQTLAAVSRRLVGQDHSYP